MTPKIFFAHLREMTERFDPRYVAFRRRAAEFRYPMVRLSELLSALPEYGAGEAGIERTNIKQPRYIRITDINDDGELSSELGATAETVEAKYFLSDGDLLFARSGATVGKCYLHETAKVEYPCFYAGYMIRFRFNVSVLPKYVFAFAQTSYYHDWAAAIQRSAGQPNINAQEYCDLQIPLPPPEVQRQIVAELDAAYAAKRKADEKAAHLLASIDDVVLSELGISKLPPQDTSLHARMFTVSAAEVFEHRMDAVAYQDLRRHFLMNVGHSRYPQVALGELVNVNRQQTDALNGRQYVGLENIDGATGDFLPTQDKESLSSAVLFKEGEILFPKLRPYLNKIWLATFDGAASTEFYPLQSKTEEAAYLTTYLRTKAVADVMTLLMTGNTLPRVQLEDILSLPVPVPPRSVQQRITEKVAVIREEAKGLKTAVAAILHAQKEHIEAQILGKCCGEPIPVADNRSKCV